jgi:1,4-dihydroxy-2-naphthoate octaprenyltransferase
VTSRARTWLRAVRLRTLPAAIVPVAVGTAVAAREGAFRPGLAAIALAAAVLIQVGTNLVNDWGDFRRGADGPHRRGPVRVTQAGLVSPRAVAGAGAAAFAAAAVLGLVLVAHGGWPIAAIGVASIIAGAAYTAGPWPLAYHGLGEAFVFVFFGPVAVAGTELVQAGHVSPLALAAALPVGLLATAILVVNNVRDVEGDARAGKRTLAVRWGPEVARGGYVAALGVAFAVPPALVAAGVAPAAALATLAAAPLAASPLRAVTLATDPARLDAALAATARLHLVFGGLLAAGLVV